jgi:hypothetical protein
VSPGVRGHSWIHVPNSTIPTSGKFIISFKMKWSVTPAEYHSCYSCDIIGSSGVADPADNGYSIRYGANSGNYRFLYISDNTTGAGSSSPTLYVNKKWTSGWDYTKTYEYHMVFQPDQEMLIYESKDGATPVNITTDGLNPSYTLSTDIPSWGGRTLSGGLDNSLGNYTTGGTTAYPTSFPFSSMDYQDKDIQDIYLFSYSAFGYE